MEPVIQMFFLFFLFLPLEQNGDPRHTPRYMHLTSCSGSMNFNFRLYLLLSITMGYANMQPHSTVS